MSKLCWKCGKMHDDNVRVCPYCGASFASKDAEYHTDGRTVSTVDEDAYLTSPPPKYKKSHRGAICVMIIAVVAIGAFLLIPNLYPSAGLTFDYTVDNTYGGGTPESMATVDITVYICNSSYRTIELSNVGVWAEYNGQKSVVYIFDGFDGDLDPNKIRYRYGQFDAPQSWIGKYTIHVMVDGKEVGYDPKMV